ncbi:hypothetical protein LDG_8384 [Legionella drancourtii LLAP12]|uniref:Uncharacterized protein n=1 Tax=Legionella drancourtii LLAP12 TaxID=658187 RepID=G9ESV7_9GAMM|nr:hypothetical protein LDG_8384 [Legionella drancourtii LLAP12]
MRATQNKFSRQQRQRNKSPEMNPTTKIVSDNYLPKNSAAIVSGEQHIVSKRIIFLD